jgi:hypothetical protein
MRVNSISLASSSSSCIRLAGYLLDEPYPKM